MPTEEQIEVAYDVTPAGRVSVVRAYHPSHGVRWLAVIPGEDRPTQFSTRRAAEHEAARFIAKSIKPRQRPNLLAAWDKVREYA